MGQLALASADGSYTRFLARLAKTQLLVLDDFGLAPLTDTEIIYDLDLDGASARCLAAQPSDPGEGVETGVEAHDPSAPTRSMIARWMASRQVLVAVDDDLGTLHIHLIHG